MRRGLIGICALVASACVAAADARASVRVRLEPTDMIITPVWAKRAPTAQDILRFYSGGALSNEVEGVAYLDCTVKETRALDCVERTEKPAGYGFGSAALQVSRLFLVRQDYPGAEPGNAVRLPVQFKME